MPEQPHPRLLCWAVIGVGIMVLWAVLLLLMSSNKKEIKSRKQANAKEKGKRAVRRERKVIAVKKIVLSLCLILLGASVLSGMHKDEFLDQYNNIVQSAGSIALTGNSSLQGTKEKGIDDYTGSYTANYEDFSDTEYLFGGTSIKSEAGKDLSILLHPGDYGRNCKSISDFWS